MLSVRYLSNAVLVLLTFFASLGPRFTKCLTSRSKDCQNVVDCGGGVFLLLASSQYQQFLIHV